MNISYYSLVLLRLNCLNTLTNLAHIYIYDKSFKKTSFLRKFIDINKMRQHILLFYGLAFHFARFSFRTSIYILIPKASTIWLRNSSDPIGFPLKNTELLTWHTVPMNRSMKMLPFYLVLSEKDILYFCNKPQI